MAYPPMSEGNYFKTLTVRHTKSGELSVKATYTEVNAAEEHRNKTMRAVLADGDAVAAFMAANFLNWD